MNDVRIGIDLGTCYSSVGYHDGHGIHFLKDPAASQLSYSIPSSIFAEADGRLAFGALAESKKTAQPTSYQSQFKRDLGSKVPYQLDSLLISPAEVTEHFVSFLVELTRQTLAEAPTEAVITVPATYDSYRQSMVKQAAAAAGLADVTLIAEPVAALKAAVGRNGVPVAGNVLVYDLGGGTFDVALVRVDGDDHEVLGARGLADFGGTDIDGLIERDLSLKAGRELADLLDGYDSDELTVRSRALRARIQTRDTCRDVKHRLSSTDEAFADLFLTISYVLSRVELEEMVRLDLDRTIATCRQVVSDSDVELDQLDGVLLVGGPSRMPCVREIVSAQLGRPVWPATDPELAVCQGATLIARQPAIARPIAITRQDVIRDEPPFDAADGHAAGSPQVGLSVPDAEMPTAAEVREAARKRIAARRKQKAGQKKREQADLTELRRQQLISLATTAGATQSRSSALAKRLLPDEIPVAAWKCALDTFRDLALLVATSKRIIWVQETSAGQTFGSVDASELRSITKRVTGTVLSLSDGRELKITAWQESAEFVAAAKELIHAQ